MRRFLTDRTPPSESEVASIYDTHAANWLQGVGKLETKLTSEQWRSDLPSYLRGDVLEIGAAVGDNIDRLRRYEQSVISYTGIDISDGMLAQAQSRADTAPFPVTLLQANAEDLSMFSDNAFDTVTASLVFCTVPDVPRAFAEIARVLKPDGQLVLIEHVLAENRLVAWLQRRFAPPQIRFIGCHLDRTTVQTLQDHGFRVLEHRKRLFGVMRFVVAAPPV